MNAKRRIVEGEMLPEDVRRCKWRLCGLVFLDL
jgi:hypothetical protein